MNRMELETAYQAHVAHLIRAHHHAMDKAGVTSLVIHSGSLQKRSAFDDQYWPLRVVPAFAHWCPLTWPDAALVLESGRPPRLLVYEDKSFWERWARPDLPFLESALEVVPVASPADVKGHVNTGHHAHGRLAFIGEDLTRAADWGVDPAWCNPRELLEDLHELRVFKTRYELMCLEEANRVAARGHLRVAREFFGGMRSELQLHLSYLSETQQDDVDTPYKNIVALGENAAILHHVSYRRTGPDGPVSLLVDAGAAFHGYASDITRTHVTPGNAAADTFAQLVAGLEHLQLELCARATVGRNYQDLHDEAHVLLGRLLSEVGLCSLPPDAMVAEGITRVLLPHGLGHSLGLQVHDVGCARIRPRDENRFLRNTRTIEPGQCFTIEPGFYLVDTLVDGLRGGRHAGSIQWNMLEALRPFGGIRIEDDLVVHGSGRPAENLTRAFL